MAFGAVGLREDDKENWADFHRRFRSHEPKYENVFAMTAAFLPSEVREQVMSDFARHVRADQARKLAGLYVDLDGKGDAVHPVEAIEPEVAEDAILVYDQVVTAWEDHFHGADFGALFDVGVRHGAQELRYAISDGDEATIARIFGQSD